MKRTLTSPSAVVFLLTAGMSASAEDAKTWMEAAGEREQIAARLDTITSDLSEAAALDEAQISSLAEYQIGTYMQTESFAQGKDIVPGDESTWVPLYDLEGNHFADLVPLVEVGSGEIGFITMGAIADGFSQYMIDWSTGLLDACRKALEEDPQAQAVFFPPMEYGLQSGTGINRRIYQFNMSDYSLEDITGIVAENAEAFARQYQIIRSPENEEKTELALANAERMEMGLAPKATLQAAKARSGQAQAFSLAAVTKEDVRLVNEAHGKFVPVYDSSETYYGGDQDWYKAKTDKDGNLIVGSGAIPGREDNGCGPVAAANIMCYMSKEKAAYKMLYPYTSLEKDTFFEFMITMYTAIDPAPFGEISYDSFSSDIKKWAKRQGITLTSHSYSASTYDNVPTADAIKAGLKKNKPVAALNLKYGYVDPKKDVKVGWHWVTITKYFQSTDNTRWIAVSTWGRRQSLDWDAYWKACHSAYRSGYVWFE